MDSFVTLSTGVAVTFKPFLTRKLNKEFAARQFAGTEYDKDGKIRIKFDIAATNETNDWLISQLIASAQKDGQVVTADIAFLEELSVEDYKLLKIRADSMMPKGEEEKKG